MLSLRALSSPAGCSWDHFVLLVQHKNRSGKGSGYMRLPRDLGSNSIMMMMTTLKICASIGVSGHPEVVMRCSGVLNRLLQT